jgi:hypothetical protein
MSQLPASIPFIVCDDLTVRKSGNLSGRMVGTTNLKTDLNVPAENVTVREHLVAAHVGTVAARKIPMGIVHGPGGKLQAIRMMVAETAAVGDATVTIDVRIIGGATVLASPQVLNNSNPVGTSVLISSPVVADIPQGKALEAVVTVSAGSGVLPVGLLVDAIVDMTSL